MRGAGAMSRDTVEQIIGRFGSQQRVAELLGIWQTAVSGWVRRGAIPARRQAQLLSIAQREGIALSPADFFRVPTGDGEAKPGRTNGAQIIPLNGAAPQPALEPVPAAGKDLYEIGEIPPLGHVPRNMYAWVIRRERHGEPSTAMQQEMVPTPHLDSDEVLVMVMAAGVNYNGIWAALGKPVSVFDVHKAAYHVAGSDAAGIVWAVGSKVRRWQVGGQVVVHCNQDDGDDEECNGGDPLLSPSQRIWGYETPDGSFAQFCRVQSRQLMEKPKHLTWEEAACYTLTLATAYRMLFGHPPHTIKPGDNVLVWGASGGLGVFGVQLVAASGANAIGIVSDESKIQYVMDLGAKGVINRKQFDCWGQLPPVNSAEYSEWSK